MVTQVEDRPTGSARDLPVIHGYFREHMFMGSREKADIRARMDRTAQQRGYRLGKVFEEKVETTPEAFRALVVAAVRDGAAVIVPGLEHLAIHGHAVEIKEVLAAAIGEDVLLSDPY
jgi:hypothetical protein